MLFAVLRIEEACISLAFLSTPCLTAHSLMLCQSVVICSQFGLGVAGRCSVEILSFPLRKGISLIVALDL